MLIFFLRKRLAMSDAKDQGEESILYSCLVENLFEDVATELPSPSAKSTNATNEDSTSSKDVEMDGNHVDIFVTDVDVSKDTPCISIDSCKPQVTTQGIDNIKEASNASKNNVSVGNGPLIIMNTETLDEQPVTGSNSSEHLIGKKEIVCVRQYRIIEGMTELHKCTLCDKVYRFECSFRTHLYKEHEPSGEYPCTECGKTFPQEILLNMHIETHTAEKPYCSSSCGKCFIHLKALQAHKRGHRRLRKVLCIQCGNFFSSSNQHLCPASETHGQKLYECKVCAKKFLQFSSLTTHSQRHRLVGRFCCKALFQAIFQ